jgi:5-oxoprolinase (ATP-hydrolysing) subunit A
MQSIDINCDMGESTDLWPYHIANDLHLLQYVSSINIACGAHAGDADTMRQLIKAATKKNISIGAHPSFEDRNNFGRTAVELSAQQVYAIVATQINVIKTIAEEENSKLSHVKPHGALYNMAANNYEMATAICQAVKDNGILFLYGLSGSQLIKAANATGIKPVSEVFADRTYQQDGSLTPRTQTNALISDKLVALQQVMQMIRSKTVCTINGITIHIVAETVCIHSDGIHASGFATTLYQELTTAGISIQSPVL